MSPPTDTAYSAATDALLVAAGRGDLAAFAEFYDRTAPAVFGMLSAVLGHRAPRATEGVYRQLWCTAADFVPGGRSAYATALFAARGSLVGPLHDIVTARSTRATPGAGSGPGPQDRP